MQIGLTFEEYVELRLRPSAGADPAFQEAAAQEREQMFPMPLVAAANHLRSRGYDCRPEMLELLIDNGVVAPADPDAWTQADVDAAAEHFEDCQIFVPYAAMCETLGCRYVDFLRPLREAAERESRRYGRPVPEDDQYFVMHRQPPRGGDNGHDAILNRRSTCRARRPSGSIRKPACSTIASMSRFGRQPPVIRITHESRA